MYRPTCHYAYHPADDAVLSWHELFGNGGKLQDKLHVLDEDELTDGVDELGVLLYGHAKNAYWFGSQLSLEETRTLAPYQNATGLQVTSAILAGMVWALENPNAGIVEAEEMDYKRCLDIQMPYLGPVKGYYTDWTPLETGPGCSRKTSTPAIPGNSGTCWCGERIACWLGSEPTAVVPANAGTYNRWSVLCVPAFAGNTVHCGRHLLPMGILARLPHSFEGTLSNGAANCCRCMRKLVGTREPPVPNSTIQK